MDHWKESIASMDRINAKLDLILELVKAKKAHDWKKVDEVRKKLDELKKTS